MWSKTLIFVDSKYKHINNKDHSKYFYGIKQKLRRWDLE